MYNYFLGIMPAIPILILFGYILLDYLLKRFVKNRAKKVSVVATEEIEDLADGLLKKAGYETFNSITSLSLGSPSDYIFNGKNIQIKRHRKGFSGSTIRIYSKKKIRILKMFYLTEKTPVFVLDGIDLTKNWHEQFENPETPQLYIKGDWEENLLQECKDRGIVKTPEKLISI
jgi:glutaredoxin-related protein